MTIKNVTDIPIEVLVQSFLTAMSQQQFDACIVYYRGTQANITGTPQAVSTARHVLSIKDGALDVAAAALHAFRFVQQNEEGGAALDDAMNRCSLLPCGTYENDQGKPVPWDELPEELKQAHRLVATAVVASAVAHNPPAESKIIRV